MTESSPPTQPENGCDERRRSLALNILILLGYQNAVSVDLALRIGEILDVATDPEQTDGTRYEPDEVEQAIRDLLEEELARVVRADFDASNIVDYATGFHPDHRLYITPGGVIYVKRLTERAERDEAKRRGE